MRSLIYWLHFSWECVPTNDCHYKTELDMLQGDDPPMLFDLGIQI